MRIYRFKSSCPPSHHLLVSTLHFNLAYQALTSTAAFKPLSQNFLSNLPIKSNRRDRHKNNWDETKEPSSKQSHDHSNMYTSIFAHVCAGLFFAVGCHVFKVEFILYHVILVR